MKLKVAGCGVFEPELTRLVEESPHQIHLHLLDAGLHAEPESLRAQVQDHIDSAAAAYDAVVVMYGLCGRGTSGLVAREVPVVLPRAHDCVTLFLGSVGEYKRQFARHPGTFYMTPGWYKHKVSSDPDMRRWHAGNIRDHPDFAKLSRQYGPENAADILLFHDGWKANYTRAAFIDTLGQDDEPAEQHTRGMAQALGWEFERIRGDVNLLRRMLDGQWDEDEVLVLQPGQRSALTGDDRIFTAIDPGHGGHASSLKFVTSRNGKMVPKATAALGIGIDAGGTYTDCVLYDFGSSRVLSKAKALSTHHDLMIGIEEALGKLELPTPERVGLVALSTTLATNAIIEGKGGRPGLILTSAVSAGLDKITWRPRRVVPGAMAIDGYEIEPLDEEATRQALEELLDEGVDALAVAGYAGTKNPVHEKRIRELVTETCNLPVICGHELANRLNYVDRANTVVLNARLLPLIRELIEAASKSLQARGINATLMVVKSDGTLINEQTARQRPIETVLSGPAASVSGARVLTRQEQAVVLDMGGTTTDTAILENGTARLSERGASIGDWQTSVEAAEVTTIGLGGDSHIDFTPDRNIILGPRRVIPLSFLCAQWSAAKESLLKMLPEQIPHRSSAAWLDFFVLAREPGRPLTPGEERVVTLLTDGPLSRRALSDRLNLVSPTLLNLSDLEAEGIVHRSALTPTDLLHCDGRFTAWDEEAARKGLDVFAELYGAAPEHVSYKVEQLIVRRLSLEVLRTAVDGHGDPRDLDVSSSSRFLLDTVFEPQSDGDLVTTLTYRRPIIAIGAPVWAFFPQVGRHLNGQVVIPEHAEVANAIGAVAADVVVREKAIVRPGETANYVVHWRDGRLEFESLQQAIEVAKRQTGKATRQRALDAGTDAQEVRHHISERTALSADGDPVMIEVTVEATVIGRPLLAQYGGSGQ